MKKKIFESFFKVCMNPEHVKESREIGSGLEFTLKSGDVFYFEGCLQDDSIDRWRDEVAFPSVEISFFGGKFVPCKLPGPQENIIGFGMKRDGTTVFWRVSEWDRSVPVVDGVSYDSLLEGVRPV